VGLGDRLRPRELSLVVVPELAPFDDEGSAVEHRDALRQLVALEAVALEGIAELMADADAGGARPEDRHSQVLGRDAGDARRGGG